ncbi:hypothetical protein [Paenibacillus sp. JSM ZJ436]|uniref:hypothetical protein n=1 Tax=Paenibacillus sp. JSM ZJ436 TaxID=3376190 RepID=UPI0037C82087
MDSTMLEDKLFVHLSHEQDDREGELIYVVPYSEATLEEYGSSIEDSLTLFLHRGTHFSSGRLSYFIWDGEAFQEPQARFPTPTFHKDAAASLLNHDLVFGGLTYEILYSIYVPRKDVVLLFMKEAESYEQ